MRQLIWKEWHEQGWKLLFFCIIVASFAGIGLHTRIVLDEKIITATLFTTAVLLPILIATGLVPPERNDGTLESLAALPISIRRVLHVKLIVGLALCVTPMLAGFTTSLIVAGDRETPWIVAIELFIRATLTCVALFCCLFAASAQIPTEARAAMVCIGLLLCWAMLSVFFHELIYRVPWLMSLSPLSFILRETLIDDSVGRIPFLACDLCFQAVIATGFYWLACRAIEKPERLAE